MQIEDIEGLLYIYRKTWQWTLSNVDQPAVSTVDHDACVTVFRHLKKTGPVADTILLKYFKEMFTDYNYIGTLADSIPITTQNGSNQQARNLLLHPKNKNSWKFYTCAPHVRVNNISGYRQYRLTGRDFVSDPARWLVRIQWSDHCGTVSTVDQSPPIGL